MSLIEEALRKIEEQHKKVQVDPPKERIRRKNKSRFIIWSTIPLLIVCILFYFYLNSRPSETEHYVNILSGGQKGSPKIQAPAAGETKPSGNVLSVISSNKTKNTQSKVPEPPELKESILTEYKRALFNHDLMNAYHIALQNIDSISSRDLIPLLMELQKLDAEKEMTGLISLLEEKERVSPGIYIVMGKMYEEKGKISKAIEEYKKSLLAGGNESRIYAKIGSLYDKLGEKENAIKFYREYLVRADDLKLKEAVRRRLTYLENQ